MEPITLTPEQGAIVEQSNLTARAAQKAIRMAIQSGTDIISKSEASMKELWVSLGIEHGIDFLNIEQHYKIALKGNGREYELSIVNDTGARTPTPEQ